MSRARDMRAAVAAALLAACLVAGCGGGDDPAPVAGSPEQPLKAKPTEEAVPEGGPSAKSKSDGVGFKSLVDRQTDAPKEQLSVCNLVTRSEAGKILGKQLSQLREAPQGPTCIYRGQGAFITLSVQAQSFDAMKKTLPKRKSIDVAGREGVCSTDGRDQLLLSLPDKQVLSVGADCSTASRFAARAVPRLTG